MTYRQLTLEDRIVISTLRKEGLNSSQIAKRMGRHRSTISREVKRNRRPADHGYRPAKANKRANYRRRTSRQGSKYSNEQWQFVRERILEDWSPEQISGMWAAAAGFTISHETIYRYIWRDMRRGGSLHKHLRQALKKRRKRYRSRDSRGILPGKRMIDERPPEIDARKEFGHWEGDTVLGDADSRPCVVTLVERVTGYTLVGKLRRKTKEELNKRVIALIRSMPWAFKTITADNGTEFHGYKEIEEATKVKFYFAHPYHSWERGTNENTNGLLRQYLPKRKSMRRVTQQHCDEISLRLNRRPRKRLGFESPEAVFYEV